MSDHEPIIRYAATIDGPDEFDEFIAHNATVHFEAMGECSWWMQVDVGGRSWHINVGAMNDRVKGYARCDESEPARRPWPTCTRCHHKWHGLQCKATPCTCETAYEEPTT